MSNDNEPETQSIYLALERLATSQRLQLLRDSARFYLLDPDNVVVENADLGVEGLNDIASFLIKREGTEGDD